MPRIRVRQLVAVVLASVLVMVVAGCTSESDATPKKKRTAPAAGAPGGAEPTTTSTSGTPGDNLDELIASAPRIDASCTQVVGIMRRLVRVKTTLASGDTLAARALLAGTFANTNTMTANSLIPRSQGKAMQTGMSSLLTTMPGTQYKKLGDPDVTQADFNQAITAIQHADQPQTSELNIKPTTAAVCADSDTRPALTKSATDDIGIILEALLEKIPVAGSIVAGIVEILWPESQEDVWADIEARVEAMVNQKIAANVQAQVDNDRKGIQNVLADYAATVKQEPDNFTLITTKWNTALAAFELMYPAFQWAGYQGALLGDFAQMTNLYLGLLRDGVVFGKQWGWTADTVSRTQATLTKTVADSISYTNSTFQANLPVKNASPNNLSQWQVNNTYTRDMNLIVLDFAAIWPYMDPDKYPTPPKISLSRTVYSEPFGCSANDTWDPNTQFAIDAPPAKPITGITVWGWDRIDAMMMGYGGRNGPRMGDQPNGDQGGSSDLPHGMGAQIGPGQHGPVTAVYGRSGEVMEAAGFSFAANGDQPAWDSGMLGGLAGGGSAYSWGYDNEVLSYLKIMGASGFYSAADCLVYGFRYADSY